MTVDLEFVDADYFEVSRKPPAILDLRDGSGA